jgi:hypothetical protein
MISSCSQQQSLEANSIRDRVTALYNNIYIGMFIKDIRKQSFKDELTDMTGHNLCDHWLEKTIPAVDREDYSFFDSREEVANLEILEQCLHSYTLGIVYKRATSKDFSLYIGVIPMKN